MRWALSCLIALGVLLAACTDAIPDASGLPPPEPAAAPDEQPSRLIWRIFPLEHDQAALIPRTWRDRANASAWLLQLAAAEQRWCDTTEPVAELRANAANSSTRADLLASDPVSAEEADWMIGLAQLTAQPRGERLRTMPELRLITTLELRQLACVDAHLDYWIDDDAAALAAAETVLSELLGLRDPAYTAKLNLQLTMPLIAGWYDDHGGDRLGSLTLVSQRPIPLEWLSVVSHEFAHALQDQRLGYRLGELLDAAGTSDEREVRRWLVEGDASAMEQVPDGPELREIIDSVDWGRLNFSLTRDAPNSAAALQFFDLEGIIDPYQGGSEFIRRVRADGDGWASVNALFNDPPETMEQVLHAEKLTLREPPLPLAAAQRVSRIVAPASEWSDPLEDRLGERYLYRFLNSATQNRSSALAAAEGWGVDRLLVWHSRTDPLAKLAIWQLAFDTAVDHAEALAAMRAWMIAHTDGAVREARHLPVIGWEGPAGAIRLVDHGQSLWLIAATRELDADAATLAVLELPAAGFWTD